MNTTVENFKHAPAGSTARIPGVSNVMVKGEPELDYPWADMMSTYFTNEEVHEMGYVLDIQSPRDRILLAIAQNDGQSWPVGMDSHTAEMMYGKEADAVMALLDEVQS